MTIVADVPRIYDVDDAKRALSTILMGPAMASALARVSQEKADGITLPAPVAVYTTDVDGHPTAPYAELVSLPSERNDNDNLNHRIGVAWTLTETSDQLLDTMVIRYLTAPEYALMAYNAGSLLPWVPSAVRMGRLDYSPIDREQSPLVQTGIIEIFVDSIS